MTLCTVVVFHCGCQPCVHCDCTARALHSGRLCSTVAAGPQCLSLWLHTRPHRSSWFRAFVHQPGRTGPSWLCVSARLNGAGCCCASARPQRTQLVSCLSQAAPDPAGLVSGQASGPSWFRGSARSSDPACCVPQPGLNGPGWFRASARPQQSQLVLCFRQAYWAQLVTRP